MLVVSTLKDKLCELCVIVIFIVQKAFSSVNWLMLFYNDDLYIPAQHYVTMMIYTLYICNVSSGHMAELTTGCYIHKGKWTEYTSITLTTSVHDHHRLAGCHNYNSTTSVHNPTYLIDHHNFSTQHSVTMTA